MPNILAVTNIETLVLGLAFIRIEPLYTCLKGGGIFKEESKKILSADICNALRVLTIIGKRSLFPQFRT